MPEAPPMNSPEARTPEGTIIEPPKTETPPAAEPPKAESPSTTSSKEPSQTDESKSLLNKDGKPAAPGAPEKYETFKAPEGLEFNAESLTAATTLFKELNLNQDQAQKLMDLYGKEIRAAENSPYELWKETQQKWRDQVAADPDIGGKLDQVRSTISRALDGLGDAKLVNEFKEAMDYTGAGNNPAFIRAIYKLTSKLVEGGPAQGGRPAPSGQPNEGRPTSIATALYPNLK